MDLHGSQGAAAMTKIQMTETLQELFMSLEHSNLEFVSNWRKASLRAEFRASNFVSNS